GLNLPAGTKYYAFRFRPGGDASALNPVKPKTPALLGAPDNFPGIKFSTNTAVADAASHFHLRDEIDTPVRIRVAGTLKNSPLQSYVIISEANFLKAFPETDGYRFFLIKAPDPERSISDLRSHGLEAELASTRLARYREADE